MCHHNYLVGKVEKCYQVLNYWNLLVFIVTCHLPRFHYAVHISQYVICYKGLLRKTLTIIGNKRRSNG